MKKFLCFSLIGVGLCILAPFIAFVSKSSYLMNRFSFFPMMFDLVCTIGIYSLPIVVYRHAVKKKPIPPSNAKKIIVIYGICSFFFMSVLINILGGEGGAGGAIFLWSWINYGVLTEGTKDSVFMDPISNPSAYASPEKTFHQFQTSQMTFLSTPIPANTPVHNPSIPPYAVQQSSASFQSVETPQQVACVPVLHSQQTQSRHQYPATPSASGYCVFCGKPIPPSIKKCPFCGIRRPKKYLVPVLLLSISVAVLCVMSIYLLLNNSSLKNQVSRLEANISLKAKTISKLEKTIDDLEDDLSLAKKKSGYYDDICSALRYGNIGASSYQFKSNESVIIVRKNEINRFFTLTTAFGYHVTVNLKCSSNVADVHFEKSEWYSTVNVIIEPLREGICVVTFSNNQNAESFKVIIIVTA